MKDSLDKAIDKHSGDYVSKYEQKRDGRVERLRKYIKLQDSDSVADFGCGNGLLMLEVADQVREYVGIDFSSDFIDAAEAKRCRHGLENCRFILGEIDKICPKYPGYFTKAFLLDFSEHVADADLLPILRTFGVRLGITAYCTCIHPIVISLSNCSKSAPGL